MSAVISFINSCFNFYLDFLCLVGFALFAGLCVSFVATFGLGSAAFFGVASLVGVFYWKKMLLKLLRTFTLPLNNNPKLT